MRVVAVVLLSLGFTAPAFAQSARPLPTVATLAAGEGPHRQALPVAASDEEVSANRPRLIRGALARFLETEGAGWSVRFDRRSGQPILLEGPGLPLGGDTIQGHARGLLARFAGLLGIDEDVVADGEDDARADVGHLRLRKTDGGDARLTFVVNHGRLIQIHAERWIARHQAGPMIDRDAALQRMRDQAGAAGELLELTGNLQDVALAATDEPPGVYTGAFGSGYDAHRAWVFRFKRPDDIRTFVAYVDAETGTLLDLFDDNRYEGRVTGGVFVRTIGAVEAIVPFELARVDTTGGPITTDLGGGYLYPGGVASTSLAGAYFSVNDNCGAPLATTSVDPGRLDLGTSKAGDCQFSLSGHSTRSARTAFFQLNNVRRMGIKWLDGVNAKATNWFGTTVQANVNIAQNCNAFWDGTALNLFRSGGGCGNSGEIADVMHHEWAHGLDQNTKSGSLGDFAKQEAIADGLALLMSHDACVGPGIFDTPVGETLQCPTSIRDLQFHVTTSNISLVCPHTTTCQGALGFECHCESHLLSGAYWGLSQAFVQRYGSAEGWNLFERLFLRAMPNTTAYLSTNAGNAYLAWLAADDDNGNIVDGTPHADLIFQGFNAQGLASGTQPPAFAAVCTPALTAPALQGAGDSGGIHLSWDAVPGASSYALFRRLAVGGPAFLPLAGGIVATTYDDAQAAPGYDYEYQVVGRVGSCDTPYGTGTVATRPPDPASDFSIAINPSALGVSAGFSVDFTVHTAFVAGDAQPIALSISGLPPGVTASFNPATVFAGGDSTLTLATTAAAVDGTTTFTVLGTAATGTHSASADLTVTHVIGDFQTDFSIALVPAVQTLFPNGVTSFQVVTAPVHGSAQVITLSITGLPASVTAQFTPPTVIAGGTATLVVQAAAGATTASVPFVVTGTAPSAAHSVPGQLEVVRPDFSLGVSPASTSVVFGHTATVTINTATLAGPPQFVTLTIAGLPSGVTGSFSPQGLASGASSTLTLTAASNAALTSATATITALGPYSVHSVPLSVATSLPPAKRIQFFYDVLKPVRAGATRPIRLAIVDDGNRNLSSADLVLTADPVLTADGPSPGNANPGGVFRFVDGVYQFNLKTTGMEPGPHVLTFHIAGDRNVYQAPFVVR